METPSEQHPESAAHAVNNNVPATEQSNMSGTGSRTDGNENPYPTLNGVVHQRRRVNPESLALRLGPDLVRDLDALITPGNMEMPSFAVRKELQERYNIDRRHIYDYFHSRGLRVVKEDKHGNPMVVKDLPAPLPNLRPLRQVPIKTTTTRSHPSYPVTVDRKFRGVTKAKPGRPRKTLVNHKVAPTIACELNESANPDIPVSEPSPGMVPAPAYVSVNPLLPDVSLVEENHSYNFNSVVNPLDESFSVRRAIGDIAYAYRHKSVFERMQELTESPVKLAPADDRWALSWNDMSPCSASSKGLLLHAKSLSWDERHAIYETLSDSVGPAQGIQECQGTYRKHMEARTKLYFEGLVSVPHHPSARTSPLLDRKHPLGSNEFRHWLSETRFLKRDNINGSPRFHPSHRSADAVKQQDMLADGAIDKQYLQGTNFHWQHTLDELFPRPGDNLDTGDSIMDSPVVHARKVTRMTAEAQGAANERSAAGDQPLLSVISNSSLPLPDKSATETRRTGQPQFHGLSGFSGPQEVQNWVSVGKMYSHPQRLEHVPYVAYSGRGYAVSETSRKGRNASDSARSRLPSSSPRKSQIRDWDRIRTRPVDSRDARRRTSSAAGDI